MTDLDYPCRNTFGSNAEKTIRAVWEIKTLNGKGNSAPELPASVAMVFNA